MERELITKSIAKALPAICSTEDTPMADKKVIVRFFCPWNNWSWYAVEGEKLPSGDWELFGMVHGDFKEAGTFMLSELKRVIGPLGMRIERDILFDGAMPQ